MEKRALILAGGKGTRLRPYTVTLPKPLMPVGEFPILEIVIRQLVRDKFDHITIAVNHQADIIRAFFGDGSKWGINIDYSLEDKPLSTIGPLQYMKNLPENFLVMNGDVLTDLNFAQFFDFHVKNNFLFTVSSHRRDERSEYGVLEVDDAHRLTAFKEKPTKKLLVSMGVYMAHKDILSLIPKDQPYGFDSLMFDMLRLKKPVTVQEFGGYWLDIGRPDDYAEAVDVFEQKRSIFLTPDSKPKGT